MTKQGFVVKRHDWNSSLNEFYTGKAGPEYLDVDKTKAFVYASKEEAELRAGIFQRFSNTAHWSAVPA